MKKLTRGLLFSLMLVGAVFTNAYAVSSYLTGFENTYPGAKGSAIDSCTLCHSSLSTYATNAYGSGYAGAGHSFAAIESADSDGDGFSNIAEINAKTFPGNAASKPTTPPANKPPVANAGPDQTVAEGAKVTLNGSNSSDPDGTIASYAWKQTTGPGVTLSNAAAAAPTFTAPTVGTTGGALTFQLTVTDNGGLTATDSCIVNVTSSTPPSTNKPPVANAGPDQTVDARTVVTLDGSNSTDPDDGIASYLWKQTAGPAVTLSSTTDATPTFTAPIVGPNGGSLTFRLTVTDNGGLKSTDTCIINVNPGNTPPANLVPIADAGPNQHVRSGARVRLNGSNSSDPDNGIASYHWKQVRGPAVLLSKSTAVRPTFQAPRIRHSVSLLFRLTITDKGGLRSSDTCIVQVSPVSSPSDDTGDDDGETQDD